jgi:hypothetical protein
MDHARYISTSRAFSLPFFFRNSDLFLFKSKISPRTDSGNLSVTARTINGNVDSQGAPSASSQVQIRPNHHPPTVNESLPHSNYETAAEDPGISHWFSKIIEGVARREFMKLYLDQFSLEPRCVVSSSAVWRRTPKMGHMIWPGAAEGDYDGARTY